MQNGKSCFFNSYCDCWNSYDYCSKKITERENSKIKSEMGVRICGIVLVVLGIASYFV